MRLIELRVRSFCRVNAVDIRPSVGVTPIKGENESGKTSTLDALWVALKGRSVAPPQPIRKGSEKCVIQASLGDDQVALTVTRTFTRTQGHEFTQSLDVRSAEGERVTKSPQAMLDALCGELGFDPLAFERAVPKEQFEMMRALIPGVDFDDIAKQRKAAFDERTVANRQAEAARARAMGITVPPGPRPQPVDISAALEQLQAAARTNERRRTLSRDLIRKREERDQALDKAEQLRAQASTLERRAADLDAEYEADTETLRDLPEVDETALRATIDDAEKVTKTIAAFDTRDEHLRQVENYSGESERLTAAIADLDKQREEAIAKAKLPVEGLGLGDGEVTYNELPLSQASAAVKMKVSVAVAMALNPNLKVVLVRDGSLLDKKSLAALAEAAAEKGFDVLLETVDTTTPGGFEIVDGANADAPAPTPTKKEKRS